MRYRIHTDIPHEARREAYKQIYKTCNLSQEDKDKLMGIGMMMDTPKGTPEKRLAQTIADAQQVAAMRNATDKVTELAEKAERLTIELEPKIKQRRIAKGLPESYIPDQRYW